MKLFLDTNIYLDFLLERDPFYNAAASLLSYAADGVCDACISATTIINANYICVDRCKMPLSIMKMKVFGLKDFLQVLPISSQEVYSSYDYGWKDFEDGVQYFCAKKAACD